MTTSTSCADTLVEFVRGRDWVTFVEIQNRLRPSMNVDGDKLMTLGPCANNLVLWAGLSDELIDLLDDLLAAGKLYLHSACVLTYLADGGMLKFPLAKRCRAYKKEHWLPVCFRVVPLLSRHKRQTT